MQSSWSLFFPSLLQVSEYLSNCINIVALYRMITEWHTNKMFGGNMVLFIRSFVSPLCLLWICIATSSQYNIHTKSCQTFVWKGNLCKVGQSVCSSWSGPRIDTQIGQLGLLYTKRDNINFRIPKTKKNKNITLSLGSQKIKFIGPWSCQENI